METQASVKIERDGNVVGELPARRKELTINVANFQLSTQDNTPLGKLRTSIKEILQNSNATVIRSVLGYNYLCWFCPEQFMNPADLKQHNIDQHNNDIYKIMKRQDRSRFFVKLDITYLRCNLCDQSLDAVDQLVDHLNRMHDKKIGENIKKVIFPFKFYEPTLRCCLCHKACDNFKVLQEHMHLHFRNFICDVCNSGFVTKYQYALHKLNHNEAAFKCNHCTKVFGTLAKKKAHQDTVHAESLPKNVCRICNDRFNNYRQKQKHQAQVHGVGRNYPCPACNKNYATLSHLKLHTKRYHLLIRPYKCTECDMAFFNQAELNRHMPKHTELRTFQCDICSKSYGRKNTLREHMLIHLNIRKHKCQHCGQAFVQKCSWRGHMRSKHDELV